MIDVTETSRANYYQAALTLLRFAEHRAPTQRRFGSEADASWGQFKGDLTTSDRIQLLIADAHAQWPGSLGASAVFGLAGVSEDDAFGSDWEALSGMDAEALWRKVLRAEAPASPEAALGGVADVWRLPLEAAEVDWTVYELFGLLDDDALAKNSKLRHALFGEWRALRADPNCPEPFDLAPGHRPFEQLLDPESTHWFVRNRYALPSGTDVYGGPHGALLEHRIAAIHQVREIRIIEQPEYKRRWTVPDVDAEAQAEVRSWALGCLEHQFVESRSYKGSEVALAWLRTNPRKAGSALERYLRGDGLTWTRQALADESVPYLAALRFTPSGLEKHAAWQRTWDLQRREDAGETVGNIPVPPKYAQDDFRNPSFWSLRGKLDVPKERFISYPGCESDEDGEPVYGWAGWDHLQRAQALAALYNARREEGWAQEHKKERLKPMLAGLLELLPWLIQWHNDPHDELGGARPGEQFALFLEAQCTELGFMQDELRAWRPEGKKAGGKRVAAPRKAPEQRAAAKRGPRKKGSTKGSATDPGEE